MYAGEKMTEKALDAIDTYLHEKCGGDAEVFGWLRRIARPYLQEKNKSVAFNTAAEAGLEILPKDDLDISLVSSWLKFERERKAPWTQRLDEAGIPKKITHPGFVRYLNAALKSNIRHKHAPYHGNLDIKASSMAAWKKFTPDTPAGFYADMTRGLPSGTKIELRLKDDGEFKKIEYTHNHFFYSRYKDEPGIVYHGGAEVHSRHQRSGITRQVNKNLFGFYKKQGIKSVEIHAGEVGAYTWARTGFVPSLKSWKGLAGSIGDRLDFLTGHSTPENSLPEDYVKTLRSVLQNDDPKNFWFIVDQRYECYGQPLGKLLTLEWKEGFVPPAFPKTDDPRLARALCWAGQLDMQDPDCVARMEAYCNTAPAVSKPVVKKEKAYGRQPQAAL